MLQMAPRGILGVPKNLKLLAVPMFELYDNSHRYGSHIASIPQLISRMDIRYMDANGKEIVNASTKAYKRENIHVYRALQFPGLDLEGEDTSVPTAFKVSAIKREDGGGKGKGKEEGEGGEIRIGGVKLEKGEVSVKREEGLG